MSDNLFELGSLSSSNFLNSSCLFSILGGSFLFLDDLGSDISRRGSACGRRSTSDVTLDGNRGDSSWIGSSTNGRGSGRCGGGCGHGAIFVGDSLGNFTLDKWEFVDGGNSLSGDGLNFLLKSFEFFLLRSDRLARGELSDLLGNRGDDLLNFLDSFLDGFFFLLDVFDLSFDDLNLSFILGILNLFLISLDVLFNNFKFLFSGLKSNFISFLDLSLLVNLGVDSALEGLDLFSLDE